MAHKPDYSGQSTEPSAPLALLLAAPPDYQHTSFCRLPGVTARFQQSRGKTYLDIHAELFPPGVSTGANSKAWPTCELDLYAAAFVQGFTRSELRELTRLLMAARRRAGLSSAQATPLATESPTSHRPGERAMDTTGDRHV